jgi:hypothetical protein
MKTLTILLLVLCTGACVYTPERGNGQGYRAPRAQGEQERVLICHKDKQTMELPVSALNGHLNHGDRRGPC